MRASLLVVVAAACGGSTAAPTTAMSHVDVPCLPRVDAPVEPAPATKEWMAWTTQVDWLHVGTIAEYERAQPVRDEVWGGDSDAPLVKTAVSGGPWATQAEALDEVCARLTGVHLASHPSAFPKETVQGTLDGAEYHLQLGRLGVPDDVLWTAQNYDHGDQLRILREHGISPRVVFPGPRWIAHVTGVGTMDGPQPRDAWFLIDFEPQGGTFALPDGSGGTFGYSYDEAHGPFDDNFAQIAKLRALALPEAGGFHVDSIEDPAYDFGRPRCPD